MRIYRPMRNDGGKSKPARRWYIELKDHHGIVRRFAGYEARTKEDKRLTEELGRKIENLIKYKGSGTKTPADLYQWAVSQPPAMKERFVEIGLLDQTAMEAGKDLAQHIEAFRQKLIMGFKPKMGAGKTSDIHVKQTTARVQRIIDGCGFRHWTEINLSTVQALLIRTRRFGCNV